MPYIIPEWIDKSYSKHIAYLNNQCISSVLNNKDIEVGRVFAVWVQVELLERLHNAGMLKD